MRVLNQGDYSVVTFIRVSILSRIKALTSFLTSSSELSINATARSIAASKISVKTLMASLPPILLVLP